MPFFEVLLISLSMAMDAFVVCLAAGVFYYFQEDEVKTFLKRIADVFPGCEVFLDACSPRGVEIANKRVINSSGLDEKSYLKWGLKNTEDIFILGQSL